MEPTWDKEFSLFRTDSVDGGNIDTVRAGYFLFKRVACSLDGLARYSTAGVAQD